MARIAMERERRDGIEESQTKEVGEEDGAHVHDSREKMARDVVLCLTFS